MAALIVLEVIDVEAANRSHRQHRLAIDYGIHRISLL
jgi:hypothetical protein